MTADVKIVMAEKLAVMTADAAQAPRRRTHYNLHDDQADPVQRMVIGLEPGTYVRPHHHAPGVWELFVLLRGACAVLLFDDDGVVTRRTELRADCASLIQLPEGAWHSIVCLEAGTAVFEVKPGPYRPSTDKDFVAWAPREGEDGAADLVRWMEGARPGARFPSR